MIIGENGSEFQFSLNHHFAKTLASMILFRGVKAERELLNHFGEKRLTDMLNKGEPSFAELLAISDIPSLPLSSFQIRHPGDFADFDIAYAEILYTAHTLNSEERADLARKMLQLVSVRAENGSLHHIVPEKIPVQKNGSNS